MHKYLFDHRWHFWTERREFHLRPIWKYERRAKRFVFQWLFGVVSVRKMRSRPRR